MDQAKRIFQNNSKWLVPVILAFLCIVLAFLFSRYFRWPVGVGYDSVIYLNGAKSLAAGNGFAQNLTPITHYPPLYPASVALVSLITGKDIIPSATSVVIILYGLNIFLAGILVWRITDSTLAGIGISLVTAGLSGFVSMHLEAMSEPLFFAFLLFTLIFLMEYFRSGKLRWAILAGLFSGLSVLTRYIGVFVIAVTALSIFIFKPGPLMKRLPHAVISGLMGCLPLVAWLFRNQLVTGGLTNRTFAFHPQDLDYFLFAAKGFSDLLGLRYIKGGLAGIPGSIFIVAAFLVLALGVYFLFKNRKLIRIPSMNWKFLVICLLSIVFYIFFLLFSATFYDASTRLTGRILSPLYLILILGFWVLIWPAARTPLNKKMKILLPVFIVLLIMVNLPGFNTETALFRQKGDKFTGKAWSTSPTISWLNQLPDTVIIYSNEAVPIGFLTGHPALTIPEKVNSLTGLPSETFKDRTAAMQNDLNQGKAVLVIMSTKAYSDIFQPKAILTKDLLICKTMDDSIVYSTIHFLGEVCGR